MHHKTRRQLKPQGEHQHIHMQEHPTNAPCRDRKLKSRGGMAGAGVVAAAGASPPSSADGARAREVACCCCCGWGCGSLSCLVDVV